MPLLSYVASPRDFPDAQTIELVVIPNHGVVRRRMFSCRNLLTFVPFCGRKRVRYVADESSVSLTCFFYKAYPGSEINVCGYTQCAILVLYLDSFEHESERGNVC